MTSPATIVRSVADALESTPADKEVLIGFDGFVDEIIRLVDTRTSADSFDPMPTMMTFANRISDAAGLSCNIEMVTEQIKLGGNGPIMANNLVEQGYGVSYCGAIGAGEIHPVFREFAERCVQVLSLAEPGHTEALEFDDGKIMMGKMTQLNEVSWENVVKAASVEDFHGLMERIKLIGCVNWTMLPNMNSILSGLSEVLAKTSCRITMMIDLVDPKKRLPEELEEVLRLLTTISENVDVVLGLNENESRQVADVLFGEEGDDLCARAQRIRTELGLLQVVIHPTHSACVATAEGEWEVQGPYTPKPKLTTGAGDNFNAGYCNGLLTGLDPEACLMTGVCSSGFYVRNCRSATRPELAGFARQWADVDCGEME